MKKGECKIDVTFEIDLNSILNVKAVEKSQGITNQIKIMNDIGTIDDTENTNTK